MNFRILNNRIKLLQTSKSDLIEKKKKEKTWKTNILKKKKKNFVEIKNYFQIFSGIIKR